MEELLKALILIQDTCQQHVFCRKCPMYCRDFVRSDNAGRDDTISCCNIKNSNPALWKLVNDVPEVKLFKEV